MKQVKLRALRFDLEFLREMTQITECVCGKLRPEVFSRGDGKGI